jgi:hypothetical protein
MIDTSAMPLDPTGRTDPRQDELAPKLLATLIACRTSGDRPSEQSILGRLRCECGIKLAFADELVKGCQ